MPESTPVDANNTHQPNPFALLRPIVQTKCEIFIPISFHFHKIYPILTIRRVKRWCLLGDLDLVCDARFVLFDFWLCQRLLSFEHNSTGTSVFETQSPSSERNKKKKIRHSSQIVFQPQSPRNPIKPTADRMQLLNQTRGRFENLANRQRTTNIIIHQ